MLLTGWAALWLAACLCATCYSLLALNLSSWAVLRLAACLCATCYSLLAHGANSPAPCCLQVDAHSGQATGVTATDRQGQKHDYPADAIVFAVGITGEAAATTLLLLRKDCCGMSTTTCCSKGEPHCAALQYQWRATVPADLTHQQGNVTTVCCSTSTVQPCQQLMPLPTWAEQQLVACTTCSPGKRTCRADASDLRYSAGMQKLVSGCSSLAQRPEFRKILNLSGLDVIATRLW